MYDIKPLEEKWEKYNQKKRKPWYLLGLGVFSFLIIVFLLIKPNGTMKDLQSKNEVIVQENLSSVLLNKSLSNLEIKKKISLINYSKNDIPLNIDPIDNTSIKMEIKKPVITKKVRKKIHLDIIETTSVSAYQDVANRFYSSHDIDDSLFLARSYYNKGNYKKAEYWALETNKIDDNIEESWLIFANSKVKQKNKGEAIRILTNYIKRSNSKKAKRLLIEIKRDI